MLTLLTLMGWEFSQWVCNSIAGFAASSCLHVLVRATAGSMQLRKQHQHRHHHCNRCTSRDHDTRLQASHEHHCIVASVRPCSQHKFTLQPAPGGVQGNQTNLRKLYQQIAARRHACTITAQHGTAQRVKRPAFVLRTNQSAAAAIFCTNNLLSCAQTPTTALLQNTRCTNADAMPLKRLDATQCLGRQRSVTCSPQVHSGARSMHALPPGGSMNPTQA